MRILLVMLFFATLIYGCRSKDNPNEDTEQILIRLNNLYDSALVHNDTGVLKRLYADDFVYTNPEGKVLTKGEQISSIAVSEMKWQTGKSQDVKIKVFGDAAVMTGAFLATGSYRGNPLSIHERYTAVWLRKDTTWQMVAEQGNIIKE